MVFVGHVPPRGRSATDVFVCILRHLSDAERSIAASAV